MKSPTKPSQVTEKNMGHNLIKLFVKQPSTMVSSTKHAAMPTQAELHIMVGTAN